MKKSHKPGFIKSCVQRIVRWADLPAGVGDGFAYNRECQTTLSHDAMLRLSAAWACITLLSDTIGTLPLSLYKRTPNGRVAAVEHPLYRVLHRQANADMTSGQWIGAITANMLIWGKCYTQKETSAGNVIAATPLQANYVTRERKTTGGYQYRFTDNRGKQQVLSESQVMHIPAFSLDGQCGLSPISYGANMFGAASSAETAARKTFQNGLMPTVGFGTETILKKEQREEMRESFTNSVAGAMNAGKPFILEGGMKPYKMGINPTDAQLLETRAFSVEEICSWFRVQPFMIGRAADGQTNWGTGIEQQMIGFITFTLRPWLARIEQAISKDMLKPEERDEYYAEFSLEGLLRGDSAARQQFYASALQNGWMSRNDVRRLENQPSIDGGDIYTVQSNLVPVEKVGQAPQSPGITGAMKQMQRQMETMRRGAGDVKVDVHVPPPVVSIEKLDIALPPLPEIKNYIEVFPTPVHVQAPIVKASDVTVQFDADIIARALVASGKATVDAIAGVTEAVMKPTKAVFDSKGAPIGTHKVDKL